MAPEQVEGKPATAAADLYALGVVLYEMVTGRLPFDGTSAQEIATRRLTTLPGNPRQHRPDLPARWEQTILRCLARHPGERFASAAEVARALRGEVVVRRRWPYALVALALAGGALWATRRDTAPAERRTVCVLGLKNVSGRPDTDWLSIAVAETLEAQLGDDPHIRTVPGEEVALARRELGLGEVDSLGRDSLDRLSRRLDADVVVTGSYLVHAGEVRFQLRLQRTGDGEVSGGPISEQGSEAEVMAVIDRAAGRVRDRLGARQVATRALPGSPQAARLYAEGLERLRAFDPVAARVRLERAVALAPTDPLIHLALADVADEMEDTASLERELGLALAMAQELPATQRTFIEARHRRVKNDPGAIALFAELHRAHPDDTAYVAGLVKAQVAAGQLDQARAVVRAARARATDEHARLLVDLTDLVLLDNEWGADTRARNLALTLDIAERARDRGARRLAASKFARASSFARDVDVERAAALLAEAHRLAGPAPDAVVVEELGSRENDYRTRIGTYAACRSWNENHLAAWRKRGNAQNELILLSNLSGCLLTLGEPFAAEQRAREVLALYDRPMPNLQEPVATGRLFILQRLAQARAVQGDLAGATTLLDDAQRFDPEGKLTDIGLMGRIERLRVLLAQDRPAEARAQLTAFATAPPHRWSWRLWAARLALAEGRLDEAADLARAHADAEPARAFRRRAEPLTVLVHARLAQKDDDAARAAGGELAALVPFLESPLHLQQAMTALALVRARGGDVRGARAMLAGVIDDALARKDAWTELEARLADAQLAGKPALAALERDARARGFLLIARQARLYKP